jgi:hypothetical protein
MPYTKNNTDKGVEFNTSPEEAPSLLKAIMVPIAIPIFILFAINFMLGLGICAVVGIWMYFSQKSDNVMKYRHPASFSVSREGIRLNGQLYLQEDIHRIIIRNHLNEQYVFVPDHVAYHNPESTRRGLKLRERLTAVSYRVDMEANGKAVTLAGGITEPTAYAVMQDVSAALNA